MSWYESVARIPADVEQPDKIIGSFTARQVFILGGTGASLYAAYMAVGDHVPLVACAAVALPVAIAAILLAVGRHDGISLDRYVLAAIRHHRAPKHLVSSPEDIPMPPTWIAAGSQRPPAPLKLPARGVAGDGLIDLGPDGIAAVAEVSTVSFALRTPDEQDALAAVFGRWLNSLSGPAQILVRAERVDLTQTIASLQDNARQLPHPALVSAALEHAAFLDELSTQHDLLRRQVLLIIREPAAGATTRDAAAARALRRLDEASRVLGSCGLTARLLNAHAVAALLTSCFDPSAPPLPDEDMALPGEVVTAGGSW
ncbi:PrgI family protein [Nonomuraea sp. NEAU-A123]|uniref:PrgI family protein n=1 Tax=Nonomuraea sp. NEAU-A123 TaxID=2839649 RepID=UPI001BE41048|nr:PrgI family protein [Nonomuraea sp. NEAU-A123]MBT2233206.1 PrgI family protein [Nonomuraea sp. NEAU-A123]